MDVLAWLRNLGLERYETAFVENDIEDSVLSSLTYETLKELGVTSIGHRIKLLDAIAVLEKRANAKLASDDAPLAANGPSAVPSDRAERRQVTVMFSDMVGSTALSTRIDPEDLREIISAYQRTVAETVQGFGGFVAKYMGDGVLIYFGYPEAHEDDAERAVRAALEVVAAVGALKAQVPLQTRVGIGTGLVVVGDLIGSGASREQAIVGETPNLAARLQGVAEPNAVVVAESTRALVGDLFDFGDLGPQELKGIANPVRAWVALRSSAVESRFDALRAGGLTDLVGREEEIELLLRRWSKAETGNGQVVLLSGEAGIGKSRLVAALKERLSDTAHEQTRYYCSPLYKDSALYPVIRQIQHAAGFSHEDGARAKLDKLDAMLVRASTAAEDAALLAEMLTLPNDGRYPIATLAPQQRRDKTIEALVQGIMRAERDLPKLVIFEDVHWIDPTSLEMLSRAIDGVGRRRILMIVTFRPEFEAPWVGQSGVTALTANRLALADILRMIDRVVGERALPANIRRDIVERADGIPLHIEEITKAVMESDSEREARRTVAAIPSPSLTVPASLHASLMARLDRLGAAKEVAQMGAAIGREFSHGLLDAVACKLGSDLGSSLDALVAAGLLFRQGVPPHATYAFKHALVRDAAYDTLLRGRRRELHARIVTVLQRDFADLVAREPEVLAHHCSEGGMYFDAISNYLAAAQRATAASNTVETSAYISRGVSLLDHLPPSDKRTGELRRRLVLSGWFFGS